MLRRTVVVLPFAHAMGHSRASVFADPFAGLPQTIGADCSDLEGVVAVRDNTMLFECYKEGSVA